VTRARSCPGPPRGGAEGAAGRLEHLVSKNARGLSTAVASTSGSSGFDTPSASSTTGSRRAGLRAGWRERAAQGQGSGSTVTVSPRSYRMSGWTRLARFVSSVVWEATPGATGTPAASTGSRISSRC